MKHSLACASALALFASAYAAADSSADGASHGAPHAPIGVMGDHRHKEGKWMLSYRFMRMEMDGNRAGTDGISADTIATTVPNRFFGRPMQPPTLRVVPLDMTMDMHMFGAMYGVTDRLTLMGMVNVLSRSMDHVTYMGGMGTNVLGTFETETEGLGDTVLTAIIGLDDGASADRQFNLNLGVSLPTGSLDETDEILTPMGGTPSPRLPYAMQLGSGTFDLRPALTYQERRGAFSYGAQGMLTLRMDDNDEGYAWGDRAEITAWASYSPAPWLSGSFRLAAAAQGDIEGIDPAIVAPVQTADPNNYGGNTAEAFFGVRLKGHQGVWRGHSLSAEVGLPLVRDLNGPQLETDTTFTLGWMKSF